MHPGLRWLYFPRNLKNLLASVACYLSYNVLSHLNKYWRTNRHSPGLVEVVSGKDDVFIRAWTPLFPSVANSGWKIDEKFFSHHMQESLNPGACRFESLQEINGQIMVAALFC